MTLKKLLLHSLFTRLILVVSCLCLPIQASEILDKLITQQSTLRIALPSQKAIESTGNIELQRLTQFLREYWQVWSIDNQHTVEFIYLPSRDIYQALANNEIDIAAIAVRKETQKNVLYSLPFASFQQRVFRRISAHANKDIKIGIHSNTPRTLNYLSKHIERHYYPAITSLIENIKQYDVLYSVEPWNLTKQLLKHKLLEQYSVNFDESPKIYFHAVTRKNDRDLLYKINESLRVVGSVQAQLWRDKYAFSDNGIIDITLGHYIQDLSETDKQYLIDHNELQYPVLEQGFPPYVITKNLNNITERGYAIDLIELITKKTGLIFRPQYVRNFQEAIKRVSSKQADIFVHIERSPAYEQFLNFSMPYLEANHNVIYRVNDHQKINIDNLTNKSIAIVEQLTSSQYLQKKYPNAKFQHYASIEKAILAVANNEVDAFIGQSLSTAYLIQKMQLSSLTSQPLPEFLPDANFTFASHKENTRLLTIINRAISDISALRLDDIYAKWNKSAFVNQPNNNDEIAVTYQNARFLLLFIVLTALAITWLNYQRQRVKKAEQQKITQALSQAEIAREKAEQSAQEKLTFLARMSHEIRTPMNGVLGMAESLSFTDLNNSQQELLMTLKGSARSLLALINDVLDFSKIEAGKLTLESVAVNLPLIAKDVIKSINHISHENQTAITLDVDEKITHSYYTDPTRLTQILNNLLSNAKKFTPSGQIKLTMHIVEEAVNNGNTYHTINISVQDSGIGIAKDKQALLFTPFVQANDEITRNFGGTGLGLSICQEIATAMGSKIDLQSTENEGSTFSFKLKLKRALVAQNTDDRRENIRIINNEADLRFQDTRVLIAEDNLVNIKVLSAQLERLKILADIAYDGKEALEMHTKKPYDIIISDCHMPNLDGFELAKRLSTIKHIRPLWLIAVTADALSGAAEVCIDAGFDDYMAKPCPQEQITNKLNHAYRQLQQMRSKPENQNSVELNYHLFEPQALLITNGNDIELSSEIAKLFISSWMKDKSDFKLALVALEYPNIQAITHKIKGSVRYLCGQKLDTIIQQIECQAQRREQQKMNISATELIMKIEQLVDEINHWLSENS
jgi:signal transduction histidine kinase/DNA-binding response OmpR family regulator